MSSDVVAPKSTQHTSRSSAGGPPARRHALLIVDDEIDVLESLRHLFHRSYRVLTAGGGEEAVAQLDQHEVHLILSDQRMPGMTGDAFLAQARRLQPDAIRMLFTGYADIQAVINAVNEGHIFRYILKPWDAAELESVIRQAAEQYEILAERKRLIADLQQANVRLQAANDELALASQLKSAFMEVASHEFNTPITLVLGLSELLRLMNPERPEQERAIVDRISTSAQQLARLVTSTLTVMRADDFRRTLQVAPVELAPLLHRTIDQLLPFVQTRNLRIVDAVEDDLGVFEIDAEKVDAAVVNLLTNAIKFTPDGNAITLSARLSGPDDAEIQVRDTGIGLDEKSLGQLFRPFFTQFEASRHSSGDFGFNKRGLGLGLSIVKQFVEMHGGGVAAESTLGHGTVVTVRLPRRRPLGPGPTAVLPPPPISDHPPSSQGET